MNQFFQAFKQDQAIHHFSWHGSTTLSTAKKLKATQVVGLPTKREKDYIYWAVSLS